METEKEKDKGEWDREGDGERIMANEAPSEGEGAISHDAFPIIEYSVKNAFAHVQISVASGSSDSIKTV